MESNGELFFQISKSYFELTIVFIPPSYCNGGDILFSSSPTNFHLWEARHVSFERSLRIYFKIDYVCLYHGFKQIAGLHFYPKSLMLYINGFVLTSSTNKWKAFFQFNTLTMIVCSAIYVGRRYVVITVQIMRLLGQCYVESGTIPSIHHEICNTWAYPSGRQIGIDS